MSQLSSLVNAGKPANATHKQNKGIGMSKLLASLILASVTMWLVIACAVAPNAIDSEFANQDSQVERHKLMLAGYYEDTPSGDMTEDEYQASEQAAVSRHANSVIAKAYGRKS